MSDQNEPTTLAVFGEQFQKAIVGYCMTYAGFLMRCRNNVEVGWFTSVSLQNLIKMIYSIYDYKKSASNAARIPTQSEVVVEINKMFPTQAAEKNLHETTLQVCISTAQTAYNYEWFCTQMTGWIQMIKLKGLNEEARRQFQRKEFDKSIEWIGKKVTDIRQTTFQESMYFDFSDPIGFLKKFGETMDADCCSFGHPELDELIKTGSKLNIPQNSEIWDLKKMTKGSLMPGDMTVLMGPTNSGKTTTIVTVAAMNLIMGKYVGLITHEQNASQLALKIYQSMCRMAANDLILKGVHDPECQKKLQYLSRILQERLKFVHYAVPGKMFIEDVLPIVEAMQEETYLYRSMHADPAQRTKRGLDLLIEDYPAKLKSRALGKGSATWDEKTYVYNEFLNMGQTYGFHVLAPVQTNRAGFRVGRGDTQNNRPVDVDDVAEGFGVVTIAANVVTINRSDTDRGMGTIRFYVAKSRSSETGHLLIMRTAFSQSLAFDHTLPTLHVKPGQAMSEAEISAAMGVIAREEPNNPAREAQQRREQALQQALQQGSGQTIPPGQPVPPTDSGAPVAPSGGNVVS